MIKPCNLQAEWTFLFLTGRIWEKIISGNQSSQAVLLFLSLRLTAFSQIKHTSACAYDRIKYRKKSAISSLVKEHSQVTLSCTAKKEELHI